MENVDDFPRVKEAEDVIEYYESEGDIATGKEAINELLKTPDMAKEEYESRNFSEEFPRFFVMRELRGVLRGFQADFQSVLIKRMKEQELYPDGQQDIIDYQDHIEVYDGPETIKDVLRGLNKQGLDIGRDQSDKLVIVTDYMSLFNDMDVELFGIHSDYLTLLGSAIDPDRPGIGNDYGIPWYDFDIVLTMTEGYFQEYEDDPRLEYVAYELAQYAAIYLRDYVSGGVEVEEKLPKKAQNELTAFVDNYPESGFVSVIEDAISQYEANNWKRVDIAVTQDMMLKALGFDDPPQD
ncbi:hypothetical protein JNUCC1_02088 [Lentibacillus sp. JNUCC-1]|uniref:hypothetical protein n=1 Tax=Lentibacillus sp. JNUCC-1 TaxID=2654513 RepID=UPI0013239A18|nr:hypothetical protein [Lentibacillus sp. JNUCC-1]MUV38252.1 hypothetical protein [Lentibacillus sp. JNUCC-1]